MSDLNNMIIDPEAIPDDLMCPISMELLNNPITLPCCGRAVSRDSLSKSFEHSTKCPLCNAALDNVDVLKIPKSVNLAYLIDEFKGMERDIILREENILNVFNFNSN